MNYLSHYYVDRLPKDPYYATGLVLPDLVRTATPKYRVKAINSHATHTQILPVHFQSLQRGVNKHFEVDNHFHASYIFYNVQQNVKELVNATPFSPNINRKYFLAHIMVELLLDYFLIQQYPDLPKHFYQHITQANTTILTNFLSKQHKLPASATTAFATSFQHFISTQYLHHYQKISGVVYALSRVYEYATKIKLNTNDYDLLHHCNVNAYNDLIAPEAWQLLKVG